MKSKYKFRLPSIWNTKKYPQNKNKFSVWKGVEFFFCVCCFCILRFNSKFSVLVNVGVVKMKVLSCENEMLLSCKIKNGEELLGWSLINSWVLFTIFAISTPNKTSISIYTPHIKKIGPLSDMGPTPPYPDLYLGTTLNQDKV